MKLQGWCGVIMGALALGAGGCARQEARAPLTYEGSGIIASTALPELIAGYQGPGRRHFGKPGTVGSSEGFHAVMEGRADVGGLSRSLKSGRRGWRRCAPAARGWRS